MAREIERGATYLDKMCHKLYDEPKGHGFQVDGECRHCGGHLMTYYCEDRLYLIACEKCGALALTKSAAPQVAANLTLRKPTLTQPNEPLTLDELGEMSYTDWVWLEFPREKPSDNCWERGWKAYRLYSHERYGVSWIAYRRPPEGEEET